MSCLSSESSRGGSSTRSSPPQTPEAHSVRSRRSTILERLSSGPPDRLSTTSISPPLYSDPIQLEETTDQPQVYSPLADDEDVGASCLADILVREADGLDAIEGACLEMCSCGGAVSAVRVLVHYVRSLVRLHHRASRERTA